MFLDQIRKEYPKNNPFFRHNRDTLETQFDPILVTPGQQSAVERKAVDGLLYCCEQRMSAAVGGKYNGLIRRELISVGFPSTLSHYKNLICNRFPDGENLNFPTYFSQRSVCSSLGDLSEKEHKKTTSHWN